MEALLCSIWASIGIGVFYNSATVTDNAQVKEINFFGDGVTVTEDIDFAINGRVNVHIPCCGGGVGKCIDGYQPIQESLPVTSDGQTSFTLSLVPYNHIVMVFIDGIKQEVDDYIVSGSSLTWSGQAVSTSDNFEVFYEVFHDTNLGNVYRPTLEILPVLINGQTAFTISSVPKNGLVTLFIGGLKQPLSSYTVIGQSLTWTGTPSLITSDVVEAYYTVTDTEGDIWQPITESLTVTTMGQMIFTLSNEAWNDFVLLFIDGIKQTDYIVVGDTITLTDGSVLIPSDVVEVLYFNHIPGNCSSDNSDVKYAGSYSITTPTLIDAPSWASMGAYSVIVGESVPTDVWICRFSLDVNSPNADIVDFRVSYIIDGGSKVSQPGASTERTIIPTVTNGVELMVIITGLTAATLEFFAESQGGNIITPEVSLTRLCFAVEKSG
jgi:hypothetical protein